MLALGVDGGASKTVALVADGQGRVLGWGRSGNADLYQTPDAVAHVAAAVAGALGMAGAAPGSVGAAALSLVGADWPEDVEEWRRALPALRLGHLPEGRAVVVNDALGALAAGADGPAVAVVLGTGCAVGARGPGGAVWHSSFWQRVHGGDELARAALDAVYEAEVGAGPPTSLSGAALAHFGAASVADLLHAFTARGRARPAAPATFAPRVLDAAAAGDAVARALALGQAGRVARYGVAAARRVGLSEGALVLAGGLFRHPSGLMAARVEGDVRAALPGLAPVAAPPEPAAGALLLALGALGIEARAGVLGSLPPPDLFRTAA